MNEGFKILLSIVTLGMVAVVIVNGPKTAQVVSAFFGGFANSISAAAKG